ncbi:MAG: peptidase M61, partial [Sphingobium sp.]
MKHLLPLSLLLSTALVAPAMAQDGSAPVRSAPVAQPVIDTVRTPRDTPYPGTISLTVDATDTTQRIWRVKEVIPVSSSGPLTLLYPEWLPGKHAPRGQIEKLAGLKITANGQDIGWTRSPTDVYAFHVNVPEGAREIVAEFQFLNATAGNQGRVAVTDKMMNLQFETVSLYPAGYYVRQIPVQASVTYPQGWTAYTALRGKMAGGTVSYDVTDYETLIDSPVFAGKYVKTADLGSNVMLNMVAETPCELAATPDQIGA